MERPQALERDVEVEEISTLLKRYLIRFPDTVEWRHDLIQEIIDQEHGIIGKLALWNIDYPEIHDAMSAIYAKTLTATKK